MQRTSPNVSRYSDYLNSRGGALLLVTHKGVDYRAIWPGGNTADLQHVDSGRIKTIPVDKSAAFDNADILQLAVMAYLDGVS